MTNDHTLEGLATPFGITLTRNSKTTHSYRALSLRIAEDEQLLALSASAPVGQLPPNLLFAAVHYLLLEDNKQALTQYYPSLVDTPPPEEAFPEFMAFCIDHADEIRHLLTTRLVQTNEVGRSSCLLPAFSYVAKISGYRSLALIDVGASAGLNLLFDRYHYDYGAQSWGPDASPVRIEAELCGELILPLDASTLTISHRAGVDLNPIDVRDESSVRWLQAGLNRAANWPGGRKPTPPSRPRANGHTGKLALTKGGVVMTTTLLSFNRLVILSARRCSEDSTLAPSDCFWPSPNPAAEHLSVEGTYVSSGSANRHDAEGGTLSGPFDDLMAHDLAWDHSQTLMTRRCL